MNPGSRKRLVLSAGIVSVVLGAILVVAFWPGPKEPEYRGKKLSEWLEMQEKHPAETAEAVRAMGTNAVPFLVRCIDYRYPRWERTVSDFYVKHPRLIGSSYVLRHLDPRWGTVAVRSQSTVAGFMILGELASNAIPQLTKVVVTSPYGVAVSIAAESLSYAGPQAVAPLVGIATNGGLDPGRRARAMLVMRNMTYLGTNTAPCIQALLEGSGETNSSVATAAKASLSIFTRPQGLPVRVNWTNAAPDPVLRLCVVRAAISLATNSNPFIFGIISKGREDPDPAVRAEAVRYFEERDARRAGTHD